ncbi:MAG: CBS domain-containing protein [Candidatus Aminicenantes bacterium]|jgi:CBS domain-containing protein
MRTKIKEIIQKKGSEVVTLNPKDKVSQALHAMVKHNIGSVLVVSEEGNLAGIFTERDFLNLSHRRGLQIKDSPLDSVMTTNLIIGFPEDEVDYTLGVMTQNKIRHLPVVDGEEIKGIVSIGDLVKSQLKDKEFEIHYLTDYIMGKYPK